MTTLGKSERWQQGFAASDKSPRLIVETRRHPSRFTTAVWSPDGRTIASSGAHDDLSVKIWTIGKNLELRQLDLADEVTAITFSPDGARLIAGTSNGKVLDWGLGLSRPRRISGHSASIQSIQFDKTGETLVTSSLDGNIVVRDGRSGRQQRTITGNPAAAGIFALSADGRRLAVADAESISVVNAHSGGRLRGLSGHKAAISALTFDTTGQIIASGDRSGGMCLWSSTSGLLVRTCSPSTDIRVRRDENRDRPADAILSIAWSPNDRHLAVGTVGGRVVLWESDRDEPVDVVNGFVFTIWSLAFSPDSQFLLAAGGLERSLKLWRTPSGRGGKLIECASLIALGEADWVAVTPDDLYDASLDAVSHLFWMGRARTPAPINAFPERRIERLVPRLLTEPASRVISQKRRGFHRRSEPAPATNSRAPWRRATTDESSVPALTVRTNPAHGISSVAISNDGELLASGAHDMTIQLWDLAVGKELRTLRGHSDIVTALAFVESGFLASGSRDGTVRLWDLRSSNAVDRLPIGHPGHAVTITLSSNGQALICASDDGAIRIVHLASGRIVHSARLLEERPSGQPYLLSEQVAVSPNGRVALRPHERDRITALDLETGRTLYVLRTQDTPGALAFDPRSRQFAVGGATSRQMLVIGGGKMSGSGYPRETYAIEVRATATGELLHALVGHTANVLALAFSRNGGSLASGSADGTVRVWSTRTGKCRQRIATGSGMVEALTFDNRAASVITGEFTYPFDGRITRWRLSNASPWTQLVRPTGDVNPVCFSPNGRLIAVGGEDGVVRLWSLDSEPAPRLLKGHRARVFSLEFSSDGRRLVSASWDGTTRLWDVASGDTVTLLDDDKPRVWCATFSHDGRWIATCRDDGAVSLWSAEPQRREHVFTWTTEGERRGALRTDVEKAALCLAFSPDGRVLAAGYGDGRLALWDVTTRLRLRTFHAHDGGVYSIAFHPSGLFLATGGFVDQEVIVWAVNSQLVHRLEGHAKPGHIEKGASVRFSGDGRVLASGGTDGTLRLWDAGTGRPHSVLDGHRGAIASVAFNPTNTTVAAASNDASVSIWNVETPKTPSKRCALYAFADGSWAVIDANGRYDASNGGQIEWLHWVVGLDIIALEQLKERYYEPGLLAKLFDFSEDELRDVPTFADVRLPPRLQRVSGSRDGTRSRIDVTNRGGGIGRIEVFLNGKEVQADARADANDPSVGSQEVDLDLTDHPFLVAGKENSCVVRAYNAEGYLVGRGVSWTVSGPIRQPEPPHLWAIIAGVSGYAAPDLTLRFAAKDAEDVATALRLAGESLFGPGRVHVRLLASSYRLAATTRTAGDELAARIERPTRSRLMTAFEEARAAASSDVLVVYLAGHGVNHGGSDGDYFYLTADARTTNLSDPAVRYETTISSCELTDSIRAIPALKQVLVLDTCAAGRFVEKLSERRAIPSTQLRAFERMKDRTGTHVLAGSTADAVSYESSQYGQGVLTYSLLLGMRGAALRDDEFIDVGRLFGYATDAVPRLAAYVGGIQRPINATPRGGASFDIGRVTLETREAIPIAAVRPLVTRAEFEDHRTWLDSKGLARTVNSVLRERSAVGREAPFIFIDSPEYPGAYQAKGRYAVTDGWIEVQLRVMRAPDQVLDTTVTAAVDALQDLSMRIVDLTIAAIRSHFGGPDAQT